MQGLYINLGKKKMSRDCFRFEFNFRFLKEIRSNYWPFQKKAGGYFSNNFAPQPPIEFGLISFESDLVSTSVYKKMLIFRILAFGN